MKEHLSWEFENSNFHLSFLNWDISVNNKGKRMKIGGCIVKIYLEGTVSQNFYLGHSFYFMKCRILS